MEIVTSPYLQQLCQLLLWCCFSLLTSFFLKRVFACRLVICRMSRIGIEKCAAKLFQTHGGSDNESPKLSLPGNTFLIPSTAWALLLLCLHPPTVLSSGCQDQKRGPAVPRHPVFCPVHWLAPSRLLDHTFIPRRGWDNAGCLWQG